jgi:hypothetical protein
MAILVLLSPFGVPSSLTFGIFCGNLVYIQRQKLFKNALDYCNASVTVAAVVELATLLFKEHFVISFDLKNRFFRRR